MPFQLLIVRGRSDLKAHHLGSGPSVAGRQDGCQLQIRSSQVSRRHCEFTDDNGELSVKDLNSSNGTYVNGEKIEGQHALKPGDEVTIGGVKFRVEKVGAPRPGDTAVPSQPVAPVDSDEAIPVPDDDKTVMAPARPAATNPPASDHDIQVATAEDDASSEIELDEDDVADFLLDIDVDDDDKR